MKSRVITIAALFFAASASALTFDEVKAFVEKGTPPALKEVNSTIEEADFELCVSIVKMTADITKENGGIVEVLKDGPELYSSRLWANESGAIVRVCDKKAGTHTTKIFVVES